MTTRPKDPRENIVHLDKPGLSPKQREEQLIALVDQAIAEQNTDILYSLAHQMIYISKLASANLETRMQRGMKKEAHFKLSTLHSLINEARTEQKKRERTPDPTPVEFLDQVVKTMATPAGSPSAPYQNEYVSQTDRGNALRLLQTHGQDLRYCHLWKKWMIYKNGKWEKDETGEIIRRWEDIVKRTYVQAGTCNDDRERIALARWAIKMEASKSIPALLYWATSLEGVPVTPKELDADPWLFNCKNGTVELRTGTFREHRREDLLTKQSDVTYDSEATCPLWLAFLNRIMDGDQVLIDFIQRAVGYSLTGMTREQCMFILFGRGRNGKSTLIETIMELLKDYAEATPTSTLMAKKTDGIPNDVAKLQGARLVASEEAEKGRNLAESFIKQITGSKKMSARFMHGEWFTFQPQCKLWMATNYKPGIRGTDDGIWRRLKMMPFEIQIPEEEVDLDLGEKLLTELPGILNWAIQGCLDWQQQGLNAPAQVQAATQAHRDAQDPLTPFFDERCVITPRAHATVKDLYLAYVNYCEENGEKTYNILGKQDFNERMKEKGYVQGRKAAARFWYGIGIICPDTPPGEEKDDPGHESETAPPDEQSEQRASAHTSDAPATQDQIEPVTLPGLSESQQTPPASARDQVVAFAAEIFGAKIIHIEQRAPAQSSNHQVQRDQPEPTSQESEPGEIVEALPDPLQPIQEQAPPDKPLYCRQCHHTDFRWSELRGRWLCTSCNTARL